MISAQNANAPLAHGQSHLKLHSSKLLGKTSPHPLFWKEYPWPIGPPSGMKIGMTFKGTPDAPRRVTAGMNLR
jgi:hypothetical protein